MIFTPIPRVHYKECTLTEGKEWYISYYALDPFAGKLRRVRIKVNRIHPLKERRKAARKMMAAIDQRLALGWSPFMEKSAPRGGITLYAAMDSFLRVKGKEMEPTSLRMYTSFIKTFKTWLEENGAGPDTYAAQFSKELARLFMDGVEENYTAKTFNNYLGFFRGLFGWMQTRGHIADNPFDGFEKKSKKLTKKQRRLLSDDEVTRLVTYLSAENPQYLAICMLCYGCFIRPKEIVLLRCRDIDLEKQTVHVDASIAKNDNESYRTIPSQIIPAMRALDLSSPDKFVFGGERGNLFHPSTKVVCSREIARYWDHHVRPACGFGMDVQFYSLKDTGITNMLNSGIAINQVQQQADHSSVAMTAIYVGRKDTASDVLKGAHLISG